MSPLAMWLYYLFNFLYFVLAWFSVSTMLLQKFFSENGILHCYWNCMIDLENWFCGLIEHHCFIYIYTVILKLFEIQIKFHIYIGSDGYLI
jgi:hypothetical protein